MKQKFLIEYWQDADWLVGQLKGVPSVFSQGKTLAELENNIKEVFYLMLQEQQPNIQTQILQKEVELEV